MPALKSTIKLIINTVPFRCDDKYFGNPFLSCFSSASSLKFFFKANRGNREGRETKRCLVKKKKKKKKPSNQPGYLCDSRNNCDSQEVWPRTPAGVCRDGDCHWPGSWPSDWHLSAQHSHPGPERQQSQVWEHQIWV